MRFQKFHKTIKLSKKFPYLLIHIFSFTSVSYDRWKKIPIIFLNIDEKPTIWNNENELPHYDKAKFIPTT